MVSDGLPVAPGSDGGPSRGGAAVGAARGENPLAQEAGAGLRRWTELARWVKLTRIVFITVQSFYGKNFPSPAHIEYTSLGWH